MQTREASRSRSAARSASVARRLREERIIATSALKHRLWGKAGGSVRRISPPGDKFNVPRDCSRRELDLQGET